MNKPIYAHVPSAILPSALPDAVRVDVAPEGAGAPAKRSGWPKGKPRKARADASDPTAEPERPRVLPGECPVCGRRAAALEIDMVGELLRLARDRLEEADADARTDLLFLAARFDGFCSLSCWKRQGE